MHLFGLIVSTILSGPSGAAPPPTQGAEAAAERPRISTAVLKTDGIDSAELHRLLEMRAPDLRVRDADLGDFELPEGELYAYVLVHRKADVAGAWDMTVIVSDGRAFFRTSAASDEDAGRVVATTLVNLLRAAETGAIAPDRTGQTPPPLGNPEPEPEPEPDPGPPPPIEPERTNLGIGLHGALLAGFGPPQEVDNLAGGGGGLEITARLRSGFAVGGELRATGNQSQNLGLARLRIAAAGGYVWRQANYELIMLGLLYAEPWSVTDGGAVKDVSPDVSPFLLGGAVRFSPGYLMKLGRAAHLHLGLRVELGGSAMPRGGVAQVTVRQPTGELEPAFRVGGFELVAGLDMTFWFAVGRPRLQGLPQFRGRDSLGQGD